MANEQNFKNHARLLLWYHGVLTVIILGAILGSGAIMIHNLYDGSVLIPITLLLLSIGLLLTAFFARSFALKAQDRAIRAEESLRYYAITGDLPPLGLTMQQFVALRFAANNEIVELAHRAVKENLSQKQIKMSIKHWRGDHNRV